MTKFIPHIFTSLNLLSGCLATYFAFSHQFNASLLFVCIGVFFDFFDGFFARLLGAESALGIQLDSFADLITSGLTPGVLMYQLFVLSGVKEIDFVFSFLPNQPLVFSFAPLALLGYLITVGTAFRLARFNLLKEPKPYFNGLPAPANALFIMGLPLVINHPMLHLIKIYMLNPFYLSIIVVTSVFLMNVNWKMFSLKISKEEGTWSLLFPLLLFSGAIFLFLKFGVACISIAVVLYIILSAIKFTSRI